MNVNKLYSPVMDVQKLIKRLLLFLVINLIVLTVYVAREFVTFPGSQRTIIVSNDNSKRLSESGSGSMLNEWAQMESSGRSLLFSSKKGSLRLKLGLLLPPNSRPVDSASVLTWDGGDTVLTIRNSSEWSDNFAAVKEFDWTTSVRDVLVDSILIGSNQLFGGGEAGHQFWPAQSGSWKMAPFVTHDVMGKDWPQYGNVLERFWLFSGGFAVTVVPDVPLSVSINEASAGQLLLQARVNGTIYDNLMPVFPLCLKYKIWTALPDDSLAEFWTKLASVLWVRPAQPMSSAIIEKPIWSTWAQFHADIDSGKLVDFVTTIESNQLPISMISLDDRWSTKHGDLTFDHYKFPNISAIFRDFRQKNIEISLWIHPFVNLDSEINQNKDNHRFFVRENFTDQPGELNWWNGKAHVIDVTNQKSKEWFVRRLADFRDQFGFSSYKFDAGELGTYFPTNFKLAQNGVNKNSSFTAGYVEVASQFGPLTEVRTGDGSQGLSMMTRLADKLSNWDSNRGLCSIIPASLTLGLIGYPFVLPDMIGGNAYKNVTADKELYIRWLQAVLLFPALQFSLPPWNYDQETVGITRDMLQLRQQFTPYIKELTHTATVSGLPILRPVWFLDESEPCLRSNKQYLLGDRFLVAPVLEPSRRPDGVVTLSVYFPAGSSWRRVTGCEETDCENLIHKGPDQKAFDVNLKTLLMFERLPE